MTLIKDQVAEEVTIARQAWTTALGMAMGEIADCRRCERSGRRWHPPHDWIMRPQVVSIGDNPRYHAIVRAFEARTGIGAVLNTSFNLHGEPVVCSPTDALHVFDESGLRNLQFEHMLLRKRR